MVLTRCLQETLPTAAAWWTGVKRYTHGKDFKFSVLVKKAYGYHGHSVRRLLRFPRRHILARIIRVEEEKARVAGDFETMARPPRPLGFVENDNLKLGRSSQFRSELAAWLPLSLRLTKLDLLYSTDVHGRALECFYDRVSKTRHTLLLCQVLNNDAVIGMFASQHWHVSQSIYGDGECFLFRLSPEPECWKWKPAGGSLDVELDDCSSSMSMTALAEQFMVGRESFISMGASESGSCGLRFNADFTKGESAVAMGFNNSPLPGLSNFEVGLVEVYQLVSSIDGRSVE